MQYTCLECGRTFEEPKCYVERHGLSTPPYETILVCPYCGGDFTVARKCDCCDDWIVGTYIKVDSGERFCDGCYRIMELGDEDL